MSIAPGTCCIGLKSNCKIRANIVLNFIHPALNSRIFSVFLFLESMLQKEEYILQMSAVIDYEIEKLPESELKTKLRSFYKKESRTDFLEKFYVTFVSPDSHFKLSLNVNSYLKGSELKASMGIEPKVNLSIMMISIILKQHLKGNFTHEMRSANHVWHGIQFSKRSPNSILGIEGKKEAKAAETGNHQQKPFSLPPEKLPEPSYSQEPEC